MYSVCRREKCNVLAMGQHLDDLVCQSLVKPKKYSDSLSCLPGEMKCRLNPS